MKKILTIFKLSLLETIIEKEVIFVWAIGSAIRLVMIVSVWLSSDETFIGGFTKGELLSYYFFIFILEQVIGWWIFWDMRKIIRNGTIANFILKPISYIKYLFIYESAFKSFSLVSYIIIGAVIFIFTSGYIDLNITFSKVIFILPTLLVGIGINFLMQFCMGCVTFFWTESYFIADFHWMATMLLGGQIVPLSFIENGVLKPLVDINPFRYTFSFPSEILLDKISIENYLPNLSVGFIWVIAFFLLARFLWKKGLRNYTSFGL